MSERYELDPTHTVIGFTAKHLAVTTVRGSFQKFAGWIEGDPGQPNSLRGEITVDISSVTTGNEQRDGHLRSADFFEAEAHPQAVYRPTSAEPRGPDAYRVAGELTIRGVTRPLSLDAKVEGELDHPFQAGRKLISIAVTGSLNRKDFGLNWEGLAGSIPLASNEIKLQIDAELVGAPQPAEAATR